MSKLPFTPKFDAVKKNQNVNFELTYGKYLIHFDDFSELRNEKIQNLVGFFQFDILSGML